MNKYGGKMKIFLGNSPWYPLKDNNGNNIEKCNTKFWGVRAGSRWPHYQHYEPNLGRSLYIPFPHFLAESASILENSGFDVLLVDGVAEGMSREDFLGKISSFNPELIVFEVSTPSIQYDLEIAKTAKEHVPDAKTVFCGAHTPMFKPDFLKENEIVDFVMVGEYEQTIKELAISLKEEKTLAFCKGLIYKGAQLPAFTGYRQLLENLDDLPRPAYHFLPMSNYFDNPWCMPSPSAQLWTSRGCPFNCIFCAWPAIMYEDGTPNSTRKYRTKSVSRVAEEVKWLVDNFKIKSYYFDDDTVNVGNKRMIELGEALIKNKLHTIPWGMMARADLMDENLLVKLKEAGMHAVKYGVESGVQSIVDRSNKNLNLNKVKKVIEITRKLDIKMHLTFIFGLPGETLETIDKTIQFALDSEPDTVQFSICTPFPGTPSYEEYREKGWLIEDSWDSFNGNYKSVIRTEFLTPEDLERSLEKAYEKWGAYHKRKHPELYRQPEIGTRQKIKNKIKDLFD
ncbi:MAG: radical SAM protein [Candidatus Coatesbacteria bacterium]|nr:radical SAM protein [Candidatus Coatesbacteria bacterium]